MKKNDVLKSIFLLLKCEYLFFKYFFEKCNSLIYKQMPQKE